MKSKWEIQDGRLVCHWSDAGQNVSYHRAWMQEATQAEGSYLPPLPNFAEDSPFGGPSWFDRRFTTKTHFK